MTRIETRIRTSIKIGTDKDKVKDRDGQGTMTRIETRMRTRQE